MITWEDLIQELHFDPIAMSGAGFGPPASAGVLDNPWGHHPGPVDPGDLGSDNPVGFNPAGRVHASLADLEAFMRLLLAHDGSNTMFYTTMYLYPGTDSGVIVVTNQGDTAARDAVIELRDALLEEFTIP
ncbi:MAG: hypothetical protein ACOC8N_07510 [Spirochaetota bacterium]